MNSTPAKTMPQPSRFKQASPLLKRTLAFLGFFVICSGIIGPRVIGHGLVGHDGFQVYGGSGKALLFGVLALLVFIYRKGEVPRLHPWRPAQLVWLGLAAVALIVAWTAVGRLIHGQTGLVWILLAHAAIIGSIVLSACGTFGTANLALLAKAYRRELMISLALAILFFGFVYVVYGLWRSLASIVLHSVQWLLGVIGIHSITLPPRTLLLNKFGVDIAQYCSGIESIALFSALYGLVAVLDWDKFNHRRLLWIFLPALVVLFSFNILRVFGLIVAGYYINPHIAFSLFHTYAGMIFFILYSAVFWAIMYKHLLRPAAQ